MNIFGKKGENVKRQSTKEVTMSKKILIVSSWIALFSFICLFLSFNGGCTKTKTKYVSVIFLCWLNDHYQSAMLCSDPLADPDESDVRIEWNTNSVVFPNKVGYTGYISFVANIYLEIATNYTVSLTSDVGDCEGTVAIPEGTEITNPSYEDTLPLGQSVNCAWTDAQGADFYGVLYHAYANDSSGYYVGQVNNYTFITNNSFTIPASFFNIPSATWYAVHLSVQPNSGSFPQPGSSGNMTGSIRGFVNAEGESDGVYFYVGTRQWKVSTSRQRKTPSVKERMNAYLRQLGVETVVE